MWRKIRWVLVIIGAFVVLGGGPSIFRQPADELLYRTAAPKVFCAGGACYASYALEVGNTGSNPHPQVRVRLRADLLGRAVLQPTLRAFGKVDRPKVFLESEGERIYLLDDLKPGDRIELSFMMTVEPAASPPSWDDLLVGIEGVNVPVRPGDPAAVTAGRMLYTIFGGC